jgi:hypothetical protein
MNKAKFWLVQITMVAMVSLVFGSPVFAGPPDHANKWAATASDGPTTGEMTRLDNANLEEGEAEWKDDTSGGGSGSVCSDDLSQCETEADCIAAGGAWILIFVEYVCAPKV